MLGVGEKFPDFAVTATVSLEKGKEFKTITDKDYAGKWKIYFFWPKDFTFVCPTEIAAFGKLNKEFQDRDAQILGGSTDSEFVHHAWRTHHADLKELPFPMLADVKRDLTGQLGILDENAGVAQRATFIVDPGKRHSLRVRHRPLGGSQSAGSPAGTGCAADRRALSLQLAEGSGNSAGLNYKPGGTLAAVPPYIITFVISRAVNHACSRFGTVTKRTEMTLDALMESIPAYAKDLKLNFSSVLRSIPS